MGALKYCSMEKVHYSFELTEIAGNKVQGKSSGGVYIFSAKVANTGQPCAGIDDGRVMKLRVVDRRTDNIIIDYSCDSALGTAWKVGVTARDMSLYNDLLDFLDCLPPLEFNPYK